MSKLASEFLEDKLSCIAEDGFPYLKVERHNGACEFHAELRCRNSCKCAKLNLLSHPPYFSEMYVYPIRRGPSCVFWSFAWIRKLIFPDDMSDNFCGRHLKTWEPFLKHAGLAADDQIVFSNHALRLFVIN